MNKPKPLNPADIVIFGGLGDLALRKILPSLYHRYSDGQLQKSSRIFITGRSKIKLERCVSKIKSACKKYIDKKEFKIKKWEEFSRRIDYLQVGTDDILYYNCLAEKLKTKAQKCRVFYLATPSSVFGAICDNLKEANLITVKSRVVLEKPIGHDFKSFRKINSSVLKCFNENQVYRIDHYLGKEAVQNLMVIRFANNLFGRIWDNGSIEHVEITVSESVGVEKRDEYFENYGTLRDMVQNHLMQLLCLIAMEPPNHINPDSVRNEKLKVIKSLKPIRGKKNVINNAVRGQYKAGKIDGRKVKSYKEEIGKRRSDTETFVALKAFIQNRRWAGVPFYLRTGKRMKKRFSEIVLSFKHVPHDLFPNQQNPLPNKLIIRLQPDEGINLQMVTKTPGPGGYRLKPVSLNLSMEDVHKERSAGAYERLLMDVVRGNQTLFMRTDEVETAWKWVEGIIKGWKRIKEQPKTYEAGSMGPKDAFRILEKNGHSWHENE